MPAARRCAGEYTWVSEIEIKDGKITIENSFPTHVLGVGINPERAKEDALRSARKQADDWCKQRDCPKGRDCIRANIRYEVEYEEDSKTGSTCLLHIRMIECKCKQPS